MSGEQVFQGPITEAFLRHILTDAFDEDGRLKWFTINFYRGEENLFHSGHYGTEPVIYLKTEEEVRDLEEWSKKYPVITRVDIYKNEETQA